VENKSVYVHTPPSRFYGCAHANSGNRDILSQCSSARGVSLPPAPLGLLSLDCRTKMCRHLLIVPRGGLMSCLMKSAQQRSWQVHRAAWPRWLSLACSDCKFYTGTELCLFVRGSVRCGVPHTSVTIF
jgi:hypothetical protein